MKTFLTNALNERHQNILNPIMCHIFCDFNKCNNDLYKSPIYRLDIENNVHLQYTRVQRQIILNELNNILCNLDTIHDTADITTAMVITDQINNIEWLYGEIAMSPDIGDITNEHIIENVERVRCLLGDIYHDSVAYELYGEDDAADNIVGSITRV